MSGKGFKSQRTALRMRDIIRDIVRTEIDAMRPADKFATVETIDHDTRKVYVTYPGETTAVPIGMGDQRYFGAGESVRVVGQTFDRYVGAREGLPVLNSDNVYYFEDTDERDDANLSGDAQHLGALAVVGTFTGTTTAKPRLFIWNGTIWKFIGAWAPAGTVGCFASRDANLNHNNAAFIDVTMNVENLDTDGFFAPTAHTMTVPTGYDGVYVVHGGVTWSADPGALGGVQIVVNGGAFNAGTGAARAFALAGASLSVRLAASATIRIQAYQNSGGALQINPAHLSLRWVAP